MYLTKTPELIKKMMPKAIWDIKTKAKELYLTFDDGPIPEVTPWVLAELEKYNAKATFFCVGNNVKKHPEIYQQITDQEHAVGNHTFNHAVGWKMKHTDYIDDVDQCAEFVDSTLFRPPHGRLKPRQYNEISKTYSIIMWDVICGDFTKDITKEKCVENVLSNVKRGSIVLFHDSIKAADNLYYTLPKVMEELTNQGYQFKKIKEEIKKNPPKNSPGRAFAS